MATDHTSVTEEPTSRSFSSRLIGLTGEAASFVRAHPNLILTALTVLIAGEMWLAHAGLLPVRIEWMLGWLFFLSIAGWSGTTYLIGVTAPLRRTLPWYATPLLLTGPVVIVGGSLLAIYAVSLPDVYDSTFTGEWQESGEFALIAIVFWLAASTLIALVIASFRFTRFYATVMAFPLMAVALTFLFVLQFWPWQYVSQVDFELLSLFFLAEIAVFMLLLALLIGVCLLRTLFVSRPRSLWLYVFVAAISLACTTMAMVLGALWVAGGLNPAHWFLGVSLAAPTTILLYTIRRRWRVTVLAATGLWVLTVVTGWYWMATMGNGLDEFTGEERTSAQSILERGCDPDLATTRDGIRVVRDDDGFRLQNHTLWRLPAPC